MSPTAPGASAAMRVGDEYFPGVIDEVRIDSRARSAQALQAEMATPVVGAAH
jgi:hypothetical protein